MPVTQWKYVQYSLIFYGCQMQDFESVSKVAGFLASRDILPANGTIPNIKPVGDISHLVRTHLIDYSQDPEGQRLMGKIWSVGFPIIIEDKRDLIAHFSFDYISAQQNLLYIGGVADFEFKDQRHYVEPFAQQLKDLTPALYPLVQPIFGWLDESRSNATLTKEVFKLKLRTISWVNFFGPPYVEKYGQDFLLGLPGYKAELLPDGGVFHQLSPTFVARSEQEAQALRRQVIAYCARHGLKVTCRAPYVIPGLTPTAEPEALLSDAEVRDYLQKALATTLVLDDGTRVKPIYILWDELTPHQRQMALEAIKQAAIAEIKRPGRRRIRFEFNEIPDELDQMLAELVGRDNLDFEWVQVEMGEET